MLWRGTVARAAAHLKPMPAYIKAIHVDDTLVEAAEVQRKSSLHGARQASIGAVKLGLEPDSRTVAMRINLGRIAPWHLATS